ncbi:Cof-type HAD-IIB family hydrolase [Clostridium sp. JNZ X4-2]
MYKLVSMDMDGTLLNEDHVLSKNTIDTVKKIKKLGVKVVLVSGRGINSLRDFADELDLDDFLICLNGANLYKREELISGEPIENEICSEIIHICEKNGIYIILFDDAKVYIEKPTDYMNLNAYIKKWNVVGKLSSFYNRQTMYKMVLLGDRKKLLKIKKEILDKFNDKINANFSLPNYLEIFSKNVDKGRMIKKVADHYNIKREQILSIGDWDNDMPMIKYAGFGIAMGNGCEALKSMADYVTKSNREDGAAYALEKFILNKL